MIEAFAFPIAVPILLGCLEKRQRAHHISTRKGERVLDTAVHMTFCRQMNDSINPVFCKYLLHLFKITDIRLDKGIIRSIFDILQICQIAGIGQFIQIDNVVIGIFGNEQANHMRSYKTSTSCNQNILQHHVKYIPIYY